MRRVLVIEKQAACNLVEKVDSERLLFEDDEYLSIYNEGRIAGMCEILDIAEEKDEI